MSLHTVNVDDKTFERLKIVQKYLSTDFSTPTMSACVAWMYFELDDKYGLTDAYGANE